jgi:endo-1,4-beta-xylanase
MVLARRQLLGATIARAAIPDMRGACAAASEAVASLRDEAARVRLLFGSESDVEFAKESPDYTELFFRMCGLFAPQTLWGRTDTMGPGQNPVWVDPNIEIAWRRGLKLTGGHLLWHRSIPLWLERLPTRAEARRAVHAHIVATTSRYTPIVYSWNVVNEAIEPRDGRPDGLRNSQLMRLLGEDFITEAFFVARESAPHALLVYNDFGFEFAHAEDLARRSALLRLLDSLLATKAPIDAVGLQSHLRLGASARFDERGYRAFLSEIAARGLGIIVSELDVLDVEFAPNVVQRDADVAALYKVFLETALSELAVVAVVTWGLVDKFSWYNLWHDPMFTRWDGRPTRPLLFDAMLRPKPSFDAVLAAFRGAPPRPHD